MVSVKDPSVVFITDPSVVFNSSICLKLQGEIRQGIWYFFWNEDFKLDIETFSPNHIDTTITKNQADEWRFTNFYGEPDTQKRHESWTKL